MRHWLQLATRSWRAKPGRTIASLVSIALGVATVVAITGFYESVRRTINEQVVDRWLGQSHVTLQSPAGHWGNVPQRLAGAVAELPNVSAVTYRLCRRAYLAAADRTSPEAPVAEVDASGIDPASEESFRQLAALVGRRIRPSERGVAVIEAALARDLNVDLGDRVRMEAVGKTMDFTIIGRFERQRVAEFQRGEVQVPLEDLQELKREQGIVTLIDVALKDTSPEALKRASDEINRITVQEKASVQVTTAAARLSQLHEAERITRLVLLLVAFIALLTSFFIVVTTMSVGMIERLASLGTMRCVGVTRAQLAALVLVELLPIGAVGTLLGVPVGIGLTRLGAALLPEWVSGVAVSRWGVQMAMIGGMLTVFVGALFLVVQAARVSPLSAANPEARAARPWAAWVAVALGAATLGLHEWMLRSFDPVAWVEPKAAFLATFTVYLGHVLLAPGLVLLAGPAVIGVVGRAMGLNRRLARDQIGRAPWRSAGICWMLMVGLSLIVYLAVRGESVVAAWDFPSKLAEAFVWTLEAVPREKLETVARQPGVAKCTAIHNIACEVGARKLSLLQWLKPLTTVVAGDPEVFLKMAKLEFLEGNRDEAIAKMSGGGYVLLPPESSRSLNLHYGDHVEITLGGRTETFEVAGVIQSPALDIAVSYFQADSYMTIASSGSILASLDDVRDKFLIDEVSTFLMNFDLPPTPPPAAFAEPTPPSTERADVAGQALEWAGGLPQESEWFAGFRTAFEEFAAGRSPLPPEAERELGRYRRAIQEAAKDWADLSAIERWDLFREQLIMRRVGAAVGRPNPIVGSLRRLKQSIDADIRGATLLFSVIPLVALLVAALGVANLITVSINARTRQIAILRAVGALKSQIVRLVLAEALTLGVLGSLAGILLGLHSARSANAVVQELLGIQLRTAVPWSRVGMAAVVTILVALLAGIAPARHAARNNVVDALQAG